MHKDWVVLLSSLDTLVLADHLKYYPSEINFHIEFQQFLLVYFQGVNIDFEEGHYLKC